MGSLFLFSSREKSRINPCLMAFSVFTGSKSILSSGIPAISSELLNSKDMNSFVSSKLAIVQVYSAWTFPLSPDGSIPSLTLHLASDNIGSSFPPSNIKFTNKVILAPVSIFWVVKPKKSNVISLLSFLNSKWFICLKVKNISNKC